MKNKADRKSNSWVNARGLEKAVLVLPNWQPNWQNWSSYSVPGNQHLLFRIPISSYYKKYKEAMHDILRDEELKRLANLHYTQAYLKFAVGKMALRMLLSPMLNIPANEIRFKRSRWGKPAIIDSNLSFNLSYSKDWLLIGISQKHKMGVDIEAIDRAFDYRPMVDCYFHPQEKNKLANSFSFSQKTFFQLWTRKEALAKVIGLGLHERLLYTNMLDESLPYQKNSSSSFFVIHSFYVDNQHIGALAMRNAVASPMFYDFL